MTATLMWAVLPSAGAGAITGGTEDVPFSHAATVSLQLRGRHLCGATLIAPTTVLTSASCAAGASGLTIRAHVHDLRRPDAESTGKTIAVKSVHRHPDFDAATGHNDIAVLLLGEPVPNVQPAALPAAGTGTPKGTALLLAGWGATQQDGPGSPVLNTASVLVDDAAPCAAATGQSVPAEMLCTPSEGGKDACTGDTGGPAFAGAVVQAIQTLTGCGRPGHPTELTAVSAYRDFIDRWTGQ
ncbi:serine protease [Streptomyces sp. NPDC102487]|uniref:serine protease n=1 Tax=Streptomyces sp. NPDC102487 TaxID=3366182 RepID=UPI003828ADD7